MIKKREEAKYMAEVFWTVLKMKMRMSTKLRRQGPTPEERTRRNIKDSLASIGSCVHLRDVHCSKLITGALQSIHTRMEFKRCILENAMWIRKIQERFRSYWQVRTE